MRGGGALIVSLLRATNAPLAVVIVASTESLLVSVGKRQSAAAAAAAESAVAQQASASGRLSILDLPDDVLRMIVRYSLCMQSVPGPLDVIVPKLVCKQWDRALNACGTPRASACLVAPLTCMAAPDELWYDVVSMQWPSLVGRGDARPVGEDADAERMLRNPTVPKTLGGSGGEAAPAAPADEPRTWRTYFQHRYAERASHGTATHACVQHARGAQAAARQLPCRHRRDAQLKQGT